MQKSKLMLFVGAATLAISVSLFTACKKNNDNNTNSTTTTEDTGYATDQNLAEKTFDDAQDIADKANGSGAGSGAFKTSGCATVTVSSGVITIDFGPTNCMCSDGRNRRGKIIVNYTGAYRDSGSVHTITFDNYYQNDNKIEGTKTVTNMGHNGSGQLYYNINVVGTITKPDGTTIGVNWDRVRTWTAGESTLLNWADDVYTITGSGTIVRSAGTVTVAITTPLEVHLNCRWIEAGKVTYTLPSGGTRIMNYGDTPNCDNDAVVTLPSGVTHAITLP
ncbi:MAG: hypothetical protein KF744_16410 [Taibaiella sp.]|nr:hypothetical protein [Taibaiella sp.]